VRALPVRRLPDRAAAHDPGEAHAPEPAPAAVLALQRSAGNRAVAGVLARDALDFLTPPSSHSRPGRRRLVATFGGPETAAAWLQLRDGSGLDLPDGSFLIDADERAELLPILQARKESFFTDFAAGRKPLYDAMQAATVVSQRHAAITALAAYDEPRLPALVQMRDAMHGRWLVDDLAARDAVLAAVQLQAATDAQGELEADFKTVRERVTKASSMPVSSEWCGMFSGDHLIKASLDDDLRHGFLSTYSLVDFFSYRYDQFPERVRKWIWDDDGWQELKAHHTARGALRRWLPRSEMSAGGALDIRPGDVVLIDPDRTGMADHIVLAQSYDPTTNTLITIGGNDSGYVLMGPKDKEPAADAKRDTAEEATGLELKPGGGGKVAVGVHQVTPDGKTPAVVYGVGRPSLVDLEERTYAFKPLDKPPPPPKHAK
jgi:hypothetical protein